MTSLVKVKGKSQIKADLEFGISSVHKYSAKLTCQPSGLSKTANIFPYHKLQHQSNRNNSAHF
jgi:hypothetical protein